MLAALEHLHRTDKNRKRQPSSAQNNTAFCLTKHCCGHCGPHFLRLPSRAKPCRLVVISTLTGLSGPVVPLLFLLLLF